MYPKRKADDFLAQWKSDPDRKPLIIRGPRQVGKTETIRKFAAENYENVIEINFVEQPKYKVITEESYEPGEIIKSINYFLKGLEYFISKSDLSYFFPYLFNRIHFWCIRRNKNNMDIIRNAQTV